MPTLNVHFHNPYLPMAATKTNGLPNYFRFIHKLIFFQEKGLHLSTLGHKSVVNFLNIKGEDGVITLKY